MSLPEICKDCTARKECDNVPTSTDGCAGYANAPYGDANLGVAVLKERTNPTDRRETGKEGGVKLNKIVRIGDAIEIVAEETDSNIHEIVEALTGICFDEEEAGFIKEYHQQIDDE